VSNYTGLEGLVSDKHWLIKSISNLQRKVSVVNMVSGVVFTTHHFLLNLLDGPNKLECYITLGWKSLPGTNTLDYLGPFSSARVNGPNKPEYTMLERPTCKLPRK
jgi:hypothetical protein